MPTSIAASGHIGSYVAAAIDFLNAHAGSMFGDDGSKEGEKHRIQILEDLRAGIPLLDIFTSSDILNSSAFDHDMPNIVDRVEHAVHALDGFDSLWGSRVDPDRLLRILFTRGIELSLGLYPGEDAEARSRCWYIDFNIIQNQPRLYGALRGVNHLNGSGQVTMTLFTPGKQPSVEDYFGFLEGKTNPLWEEGQRRSLWYVYEISPGFIVTMEPTLECGGEEPLVDQLI